jgi:hypothetical protein
MRTNQIAMTETSVAAPIRPLTRDFLQWLARQPRSYAETMEAWRSSCPRLTIWEDAIADGLIREESRTGGRMADIQVVLTPRGRTALDGV